MIKINLLKNYQEFADVNTASGISFGEVKETNKVTALLKIILIVASPFAINHLEDIGLNEKFQKVQTATNTLAVVEAGIAKISGAVEIVSRFEKLKKRTETRVAVLQELVKNRLREVSVLDKIQDLVPERAWLSYLTIEDGQLVVRGVAVSDNDVTEFVNKIEESVLFADVIFTSENVPMGNGGNQKKFEIICQVEGI